MGIEAGVQFLFEKALICKDFSILHNENRLHSGSKMAAVELLGFWGIILFNEKPWGVHFLPGGVHNKIIPHKSAK